jgi:uncharacterized membrane protein
MSFLISGTVIFFGIHLVPAFPFFRQRLLNSLGEKLYKVLFSAISFTGLIIIIYGKSHADFINLWQPSSSGRYFALILMPLAFIMITAYNLPTNIKRYTRHPMLWGVTLWSVAHLLVNGDLASILLFGSFGVYSLFDMWSANRRGAVKSDTPLTPVKDVVVVVVGLFVFGIFVFLHPYLFGVSVR